MNLQEKLNLTNRNAKIVLILLGVIVLLLCYAVGYRKINEATQKINNENKVLELQANAYKDMGNMKEANEANTAELEKKIAEIQSKFPVDVKSEDVVVFSVDAERMNSSLEVSSISLADPVMIYTTNGGEIAVTNEDGSYATTNDGLMDPGTDNTVEEDVEAVSDPSSGMAMMINNEEVAPISVTVPAEFAPYVTVNGDYNFVLSNRVAEYRFTTGYSDLKTLLYFIKNSNHIKSLNSVVVSYDENSGNLTGTFGLDNYILTGTDQEYAEPTATGSPIGSSNPFLSIN